MSRCFRERVWDSLQDTYERFYLTVERCHHSNGTLRSETWKNADGQVHRINGPALRKWRNGTLTDEDWYVYGDLHRLDGPAVQRWVRGNLVYEKWYAYGELHRTDGPAERRWRDGVLHQQNWYIHGQEQERPEGSEQDIDAALRRIGREHQQNRIRRGLPAQRQRREAERESPMDISVPTMKYTEEQRERYNREALGEDYRSLEFDDIFGDKVNVGAHLADDPDNMVVRVGDVWFETQKSGISGLKPMYPCAEAGRLGTVDRNTRYISIGRMGCPCQGAANYDAVMKIIKSNLQVLRMRPKGRTNVLVSHEVLEERASWVSEAHCQEGTQMSYYETYQPAE